MGQDDLNGDHARLEKGQNNTIAEENDPLAELIRIVKEDPFASILADTQKPKASKPAPVEEPVSAQPAPQRGPLGMAKPANDPAPIDQLAEQLTAKMRAAQQADELEIETPAAQRPVPAAPAAAQPAKTEHSTTRLVPRKNVDQAPPVSHAPEKAHRLKTEMAPPSPVTALKPAAAHSVTSAKADPRQSISARHGPPPLDPIDLDQALREFHEKPDDVLELGQRWTKAREPNPFEFDGPQDLDERIEPELSVSAEEELGPVDDHDPAYAAYDHTIYAEDDPYADDEPDVLMPRRRGAFFAVGMLLGLAVLGAGVMYVLGSDGSESATGEPPVIKADVRPAKLAPSEPGGAEIPNQNKLVYDRVAGETSPVEEKIVPREEKVMDVAAVLPSDPVKTMDRAPGQEPAASPPTSVVGTATEPAPQPAAPGAAAQPTQLSGLVPAPRKVRTLTIRPDGTIAETEAPTTTLPAATLPSPIVVEGQPVNVVSAIPTTPFGNDALANAAPLPPIRPAHAAQPFQVAAAPAAQQQAARPTVAPVQPVDSAPLQLSSPSTQQQVPQTVARAAPATLPATQDASAGDVGSGAYVVQLAARKSEEQALAAYADMKARYPSLRRYEPLIQRADLGDRGVYYRLRVGPMPTQGAANDLCNDLRSSGLNDCLVRRQ